MPLTWTMTRYLALQFVLSVAVVLAGFLVVVYIFDVVAMLQRFGAKEGITFATILAMSTLKMPNLIEDTIPFATLAGATWVLARMSQSSELIIARSAGLSVWQFLAPAILISFFGGVFLVLAYDPLAALMIEHEEGLESRFLQSTTSLLDISATGLWLRQVDKEGPAIINAQRVFEHGAKLEDVAIYVDSEDRFGALITAKTATLQKGRWVLDGGEIRRAGHENQPEPIAAFATPLTQAQIEDSFASPKTMSFWQLPRFIKLAEQAGFNPLRHELHFYSMLATPLLLCAMVLMGAVFALRVRRGRGLGLLVVGAVSVGFLLYIAMSFSNALGIAGVVPVTLAAWAPSATATLLGVAFLLHFEDG